MCLFVCLFVVVVVVLFRLSVFCFVLFWFGFLRVVMVMEQKKKLLSIYVEIFVLSLQDALFPILGWDRCYNHRTRIK